MVHLKESLNILMGYETAVYYERETKRQSAEGNEGKCIWMSDLIR